jgi:hypothetical protein
VDDAVSAGTVKAKRESVIESIGEDNEEKKASGLKFVINKVRL